MNHLLRAVIAIALCTDFVLGDTVTGTVRNSAGIPVNNVAIHFSLSPSTIPSSPVTNTLGVFNVSLPAGTYDVDFEPPGSTGLAPKRLYGVIIAGAVNVGIVTLAVGFDVTGIIQSTTALPLAGANAKVQDQVTGLRLYTPGNTAGTTGMFTVRVPAGIYFFRMEPAPGSILVAQGLSNVVVSATTNLGITQLPPGVLVTGIVLNASNSTPVANADLDVDDEATGIRVITPNDNTDGNGAYSLIVDPNRVYTISCGPAPGVLLQGQRFPHIPIGSANTVLPTVLLAPGVILSGTVLGPANQPLQFADINVNFALGGVRIYTPNDSTNAGGNVSVVVPPSTAVTVTVEPPPGAIFATVKTSALVTSVLGGAPTSFGTVVLPQGYVLSGTILAWNGFPEVNANIDVLMPVTGALVPTPNDRTNASGSYSVIVPAGTFDVEFKCDKFSISRNILIPNVAVNAATTLNQNLAIVPVVSYLAQSLPAVPVTAANPVYLDALLWNFSLTPVVFDLQMYLIDPAGAVTTIIPIAPIYWPASFFYFWQGLGAPLPPLNPAHAGLNFKLRVKLLEPGTTIIMDEDEFVFIRQ